MALLIGTSGFSYEDWRGTFYPPRLRPGERLAYYARHFPALELNVTFYRLPSPAALRRMTEQVPAGFHFVVKAHQSLTHAGPAPSERFVPFLRALEPLAGAGLLGGVLAQFPHSFRRTPEHEAYLETVRRELAEVPLVVEFRHAEWAGEETLERLRRLSLGYCAVDEPRLKGLMPPIAPATAGVGYVRFHGRNAARWWEHEQPHERYDYGYSEAELAEWVPRIRRLEQQTERTYLFFNNHYQGKAAQNARALARLLGLPLPESPPTQGTLPFDEGE